MPAPDANGSATPAPEPGGSGGRNLFNGSSGVLESVRATDGSSLGVWTWGHGYPAIVIVPPFPWSTLQSALEAMEMAGLDRHPFHVPGHRIVRYDPRGVGLSTSAPPDFSMQAQARDLASVVDGVTSEPAVIVAPHAGAPVAITYAAEHPDRVALLVLWCGFARGSDFFDSPAVKAAYAALRHDEDFAYFGLARQYLGSSRAPLWQHFADLMRGPGGRNRELSLAATEDIRRTDVSHLLEGLQCPTLVLHRRDVSCPPIAVAREMASRIPGARLRIVEGDAMFVLFDNDTVREALVDALASPPPRSHATTSPDFHAIPPRRLRALELAAEGLTNEEIAERLSISPSTVKKHLHALFREFGAGNRAEAVTIARRHGLLP